MSDPHTPSITDATSAAAPQTISLHDLGMRYLATLQQMFDLTAYAVEGSRQVTERAYDEFSTSVRFLPSQKDHRGFDKAKAEAERWLLRNVLSDSMGLLIPFLEDVRSIAALTRWKATNPTDNAGLQSILVDDRRSFLALNLPEKLDHLQNHFSLSSPLAPYLHPLAKVGGCITASNGVVTERDVTQGRELVVTLVSLQLVPTRKSPESTAETISPQVGELRRAFAVGETIRFEKADYLNLITTISLFVSSMMKALQAEVVRIQGGQTTTA